MTPAALLGPLGDMLGHEFMRNALLAGTFVALACGLVGYVLVIRNQVFTGDALSHSAFTGSVAAYAAGVQPLAGLYAGTLATALGMGALGGRGRGRDVVVGTVFAWVLGLGVLFLSIYTSARSSGSGAAGVSVLFGSVYGIGATAAMVAAAVGAAVSLVVLTIWRPLLLASIDAELAAARAVPVRALAVGFLALVGVTVGEATQAVGALLLLGLLVTPAAAAQQLTAHALRGLVLSATVAVGSVWAGLTLAYCLPRTPPSVPIVGLAFLTYLAASIVRRARRR